jgi:ABC-2 type transport system ATP-binding protein
VPSLTPADGAQAVVRTDHLSKRYGTIEAVRDLSLTVRPGEIYGFLGPNGAGKTTTIRMLLGLETPSGGRIELFGRAGPADPFAVKRRIGVVGEHQFLYDDLTAWEYLLFFGRLYGVARPEVRAAALLERFQLSEFRRLLARDYSRGMQQKLGLARALLHDPELLILDEPVSGLDPHGIRQAREVLMEENQRGVTILVSSHILSEVERTAHRVGILHGGRLVAEDSVAAIATRLQPEATLTLDVDDASPALLGALRAQSFVRSVEAAPAGTAGTTLRLRLTDGDHRRAVSAVVAGQGGLITGMRQEQLSLEEAFVRLTADNVGVAAGRRLAAPPTGERDRPASARNTARASRRSKAR